MAITIGTFVGGYEVTAPIGAGGMGVVYRARDRVLNRDVALKVLPDTFAHDGERLARFKREAQVLASINHANIAAIYGFVESGDVQALVLELVEGPTLADRIAHGPIAVDDALAIARQMAVAIEAAHEMGIIHRDLKPANIKVREDGAVKVLDFGLAKALGPPVPKPLGDGGHLTDVSASPTITSPAMTGMGIILGTAAYMSPEQAKGKPADKRGDVWSFGCVLYEMLTARRAFEGEDVSDTLAAVLRGEPDWAALPQNTPPNVRALLRRCLQKDRGQRISDISTARFAIDEHATGQADRAPVVISDSAHHTHWKRALPFVATLVLTSAIIGGIAWYKRSSEAQPPIARFSFSLGEGLRFTNPGRTVLAISPDGTKIVYAANAALYLRSLSDIKPTVIEGSQDPSGITSPVFSPDGQSIVFFSTSDRQLKKIAVTGGAPIPICAVDGGTYGMSWGPDGIVFAQGDNTDETRVNGIMRVSPNGGSPEALVRAIANERIYGPQILPGGQHILFTLAAADPASATEVGSDTAWDQGRGVIQSLVTGERTTVIENGSAARYLPTGHIVYAAGGVLRAVAFDLRSRRVVGATVPAIEGVRRGESTGAAQFSVSDTGSLVYVPGPISTRMRSVAFVDRKGRVEPLKLASGSFESVRVSRDGKWLAIGSDDSKTADISIFDLTGVATLRRLTTGGRNRFPVWSPDSRRLAFQSDRDGDPAIFVQHADGSSSIERLTTPEHGTSHTPWSWSADGSTLLFTRREGLNSSIWALAVADKKATRFGSEQLINGSAAEFSPDGRLVAYTTTGPRVFSRLFLNRFPPAAVEAPIANGTGALWSSDGTELFFGTRGGWFVASVVKTPALAIGEPMLLPMAFLINGQLGPRSYDAMPDGKRLVGVVASGDVESLGRTESDIYIALNWFDELKRLVPTH